MQNEAGQLAHLDSAFHIHRIVRISSVVVTKLVRPWATIDAINEPRHSRRAARTMAIAPSVGISVQPWGWIIAKISETSAALGSQLQRLRRWCSSAPRNIVSSISGAHSAATA